ncbi:MAG: bis(5'-nucleosyl)-tetraphosphatase (symmetrical) YqeK [Clostridiales bacterium]|nr:bis(5'-nucleosyl)-tetraphosphatase (symmetrical) YqeK [Clostridiales bacterium]
MSGYNLIKMQNKLKKDLDEARFIHTQGVMYTAAALAMCYEQDIETASVAGLLHDCAKCIPNGQKLRLCEHYKLHVSEVERKNPHLLHAKLGACIAADKYGIEDPRIQSAIRWHTTGKPDMTMLEKIIFLSDYIEPGRTKAANLTSIRKTAFADLDLAVFQTLRDTIKYLEEKKACLDNQTIVAYNYYQKLTGEKEDS